MIDTFLAASHNAGSAVSGSQLQNTAAPSANLDDHGRQLYLHIALHASQQLLFEGGGYFT